MRFLRRWAGVAPPRGGSALRLQTRQLDVPSDFPATDYESIQERVTSKFGDQGRHVRFAGGWSAVCYRFIAMAEYDERFTQSIKTSGSAPHDQRVRYEQERDLFGFLSSSCSLVDAFSFGMFAIGALLMPAAFPLTNEQDEEKVTRNQCHNKFSGAFPGDPFLTTLQLIRSKDRNNDRSKDGDPDWTAFLAERNFLSHREAPPRRFQMGDPTQPRAAMVGPNIVLDEQTTSSRRRQIAGLLSTLLAASNSFVQDHVR
jgi:hypothetical protein